MNALLAYAVDGQRVLRWTGAWQTVATLSDPVASIWADEDTVIVAGYNQAVFRKSAGSDDFTALSGAPIGDYLSVWSLAADDIWLGNSFGQLVRYDVTSWHIIATGPGPVSGYPVNAMWGVGGQLYFQSPIELGRWGSTELNSGFFEVRD